jgi:hypothetical protein
VLLFGSDKCGANPDLTTAATKKCSGFLNTPPPTMACKLQQC